MKNFCLMVSLLALSSWLHTVQGVRLGKSSVLVEHAQKFQGQSTDVVPRVKVGVINIAAAVRVETRPSSAGLNRRLMTKTTTGSVTITSSKKLEDKTISSKEAGGNAHLEVKTSPVSEEVVDMAEMDYSPAKKRSPIHN